MGTRSTWRASPISVAPHGALLVVDAIQQLGATNLSVKDTPADVVVAGGHKWLNAPFGCGLLYVRRSTLPELRMPSWGYLGLEPPEGGWGHYFATPETYTGADLRLPHEAKSLEINGTANYPGAVGLGASLELINAFGIETIEEHRARAHGSAARRAAAPRRARRQPAGARGPLGNHHVRGLRRRAENEAFLQALLDERIYVAMRYTSRVGGIRISTHLYNDHEDLDRLLETMARLLGQTALESANDRRLADGGRTKRS